MICDPMDSWINNIYVNVFVLVTISSIGRIAWLCYQCAFMRGGFIFLNIQRHVSLILEKAKVWQAFEFDNWPQSRFSPFYAID